LEKAQLLYSDIYSLKNTISLEIMWKRQLYLQWQSFGMTRSKGVAISTLRQCHKMIHMNCISYTIQQQQQQQKVINYSVVQQKRYFRSKLLQQYRWFHVNISKPSQCLWLNSITHHSMLLSNQYLKDSLQQGYQGQLFSNPTNTQQYRYRIKVIDFDEFTEEAMAEKEAKVKRQYIVGYKKKKLKEQREREREKREAEEKAKYIFRYDIWEETIQNLLNQDIYPIGFSNTCDSAVIASWCQQVSYTFQQTLSLNASASYELVLQLLDRLFQEQEAHIPSSTSVQVLMSTDISSSAIECALKSWKFSLSYPPYYEQMTIDDVTKAQDRIQYYGQFLAKHEDSMIDQITKLLDVDRIVHTKSITTDRLIWGHIPHTKHPNASDANAQEYVRYINHAEKDIDVDGHYFYKVSKGNTSNDYDVGDEMHYNDDFYLDENEKEQE
jgi:hypothetical protein